MWRRSGARSRPAWRLTQGLVEIAELLVGAGAAADAASADGRTPLMVAAAFDRADMVAWLLARGASPQARDAGGMRAIDIARAMGAQRAVTLLGATD